MPASKKSGTAKKVKRLSSRTLEKDSEEVLEEEKEGKEEFDKENP